MSQLCAPETQHVARRDLPVPGSVLPELPSSVLPQCTVSQGANPVISSPWQRVSFYQLSLCKVTCGYAGIGGWCPGFGGWYAVLGRRSRIVGPKNSCLILVFFPASGLQCTRSESQFGVNTAVPARRLTAEEYAGLLAPHLARKLLGASLCGAHVLTVSPVPGACCRVRAGGSSLMVVVAWVVGCGLPCLGC